MTRQELETILEETAGPCVGYGCRMNTREGTLGCILVHKRKSYRFLPTNWYHEWQALTEDIKRHPFGVYVEEVVHRPLRSDEDPEEYPGEEDFLLRERFYVANILKRYGRELSDIGPAEGLFPKPAQPDGPTLRCT